MELPIQPDFKAGERVEYFLPELSPGDNTKLYPLIGIKGECKRFIQARPYVDCPKKRKYGVQMNRNLVDLYYLVTVDDYNRNTLTRPIEPYIIKTYNGNRTNETKSAVREASILQHLGLHGHENIIGNMESIRIPPTDEKEREFFLITEKCEIDNLANSLQDLSCQENVRWLSNTELRWSSCTNLFRQLVTVLTFLHEQGIAHQDISSENIVVEADGTLKLIDFEMSVYIPPTNEIKTLAWEYGRRGKRYYWPPEAFNVEYAPVDDMGNFVFCPFAKDIFAAGVVLFWMLTERFPFQYPGLADYMFHAYVFEPELNTQWLQNLKGKGFENLDDNHPVFDLFRQIFTLDPKERITAAEIMGHAFW